MAGCLPPQLWPRTPPIPPFTPTLWRAVLPQRGLEGRLFAVSHPRSFNSPRWNSTPGRAPLSELAGSLRHYHAPDPLRPLRCASASSRVFPSPPTPSSDLACWSCTSAPRLYDFQLLLWPNPKTWRCAFASSPSAGPVQISACGLARVSTSSQRAFPPLGCSSSGRECSGSLTPLERINSCSLQSCSQPPLLRGLPVSGPEGARWPESGRDPHLVQQAGGVCPSGLRSAPPCSSPRGAGVAR
jgi:hypothetical protein